MRKQTDLILERGNHLAINHRETEFDLYLSDGKSSVSMPFPLNKAKALRNVLDQWINEQEKNL